MRANQAEFSVALLCEVFGISRSGYYAWRKRSPSTRATDNAALLKRISAIHERSRGSYGVPRIHAELAEEGSNVSRKRIARLMREEGLQGVTRRKGFRTTTRDADVCPAPDLVNRKFSAAGPDELWVADIAYVPTLTGFLYLAVVLDVWSRRIVGWSMRNHLRTELVLEALEMALYQRNPDSVVHHSDQGTQYTSIGFGNRCTRAEVRPSMGSVGDCFDCDDPAARSELLLAVVAHRWPDPCYDRPRVLALTCRPPWANGVSASPARRVVT